MLEFLPFWIFAKAESERLEFKNRELEREADRLRQQARIRGSEPSRPLKPGEVVPRYQARVINY